MHQAKRPPSETFRVSQNERTWLKAQADALGLSKGSYIRLLVFGGKPETRIIRRPTPERALLERMIGTVGRVGNTMNQILYKLNSGVALDVLDAKVHVDGIEAIQEIRLILLECLRRR